MKKSIVKIFLVLIILTAPTLSQNQNHDFNISVGSVYITSAELFLNPNSSDIFLRNQSFELKDIFSPAIEIRYRLSEAVAIGLSTEYNKKSQKGNFLTVLAGSQIIQLESEDGFVFIPVELSVYHIMPFSTELFKFNMAGGIGYYHAIHTRKFGDTDISNLETKPVIGIQVSAGMEYLITQNIGVKLQMKFRAPEIKVKSKYNNTTVNYKGNTITILQDTFDSKVSVNGAVFMLGVSYSF
jgi:opacity protein-like surface antigen